MSLWTIVPVKPLNRAKSRLAEVLTPDQRYQFATMMLRHVLSVATQTSQITGTLVISRDTKALAIARDLGAKTIQESNTSDLNLALTRATEVVRVWGASATLILPADLPFITVDDLATISDMGRDLDTIVIATDRELEGTNALLMRPIGLIPYQYGENSYQLHIDAARQTGAKIQYFSSETVNLDVDVPEDLEEYNQIVAERQIDSLSPFFPDIVQPE